MSQISLSHQFSRRWLATPKQIKHALVQELKDVVRLLDEETELQGFEFTVPNLNEYIESIYNSTSKSESNVTVITPQQLKTTKNDKHDLSRSLQKQSTPANSQINKLSSTTQNTDQSDSGGDVNAKTELATDIQKTSEVIHNSTLESNKKPENLEKPATHTTINEPINQALLKKLEADIDDYLTERLSDISEDLKAWLRDQIDPHNRNLKK